MIIFVDTETTGKLLFKLPLDHPNQPRIVSLGIVAFSDDGQEEVGSFYSLIRPGGFRIDNNSEACKINGITQEKAEEYGVDMEVALRVLYAFYKDAKYVGFFNQEFDEKMIALEIQVLQFAKPKWKNFLHPAKLRCLKLAYTSICQIPSPSGYSDYKWPKLQEAYEFMFGVQPEGAHGALADARSTAYLAFEAVRQGLWQFEPDPPVR